MNTKNLLNIVIAVSPLVSVGLSTIINDIEGLVVDKYIDNSDELQDYLKEEAMPEPSLIVIEADELLKNDNAILIGLNSKWPEIAIVAFYMHKGSKYLSVASKRNNIVFLSIHCRKQELIDVLTTTISQTPVGRTGRREKEVQLTKKEKEFIGLICSNLTYKEIASIMGISKRTVDTHRDHLFDKFCINSRAALILQVIKIGMIHDIIR